MSAAVASHDNFITSRFEADPYGRLQSCSDVIHGGEEGKFVVAAPISILSNFKGFTHAPSRSAKDGGLARRLLALAKIYECGRRSDAARIGGFGLQAVCY